MYPGFLAALPVLWRLVRLVIPSVARFLAPPVTENDCLKRSNPPQTHFHGNFRKNLVT